MSERMTLSKAINAGLRSAMANDPRVLVMGEDVGVLGGVFRVTDGLQAEFGSKRVMDTPLSESGILGTAIGLALKGFRPVCEIQFDGFVYPAFDQIVSQLAKMRARSGGVTKLPLVIRIPAAGGIGAVEHHSESNEAYFAHTPGLRVVSCADPDDAFHLIQDAIASDDPVIFFEPKRRYWDSAEVDTAASGLGLSRAGIVREGTDCTLIAHGPTVRVALDAAEAAAEDGVSVQVVNLRSISPLDVDLLVECVTQTGRAIVVHEATTVGGIGGEISAAITEHAFYSLEAPVLRVGAYDLPYPPSRIEEQYLPSVDRVLVAIERSLGY
jgi:2-oxoisovalerate dehydrogenase E1 component beta subunit